VVIIITAAKIISIIILSLGGAVFSGLGLSELTTNVDESIKDDSESASKNLLVTEETGRIEPFTPVSKVTLDSST